MKDLWIDIETFASEDITKSGVYRYAAAPDFEVLLLAYAWGNDPVQIVDLTEKGLPEILQQALLDPTVRKHAHNANFERACLTRMLGEHMPPEQWDCTMVRAAMHGLPLSLEGAAQALGLEAQKDAAGKALIRYFCQPCKPTKVNGGRARNRPHHDPERWERFKQYCIQDVKVERQIHKALILEPSWRERALWVLDQRINDNGVGVDMRLVRNAIACDEAHKERTIGAMRELTGLANPGSVTQLKGWMAERGLPAESLSKTDVAALAKSTADPIVEQVMDLRLKAAKTSVKKYEAIERSVGADSRVRGLLQFGGASRTGRWAGRLVQVQNLPRNYMTTLDDARAMLREGDFEGLELFYSNVPDMLSQLVRTAFIPSPWRRFIIGDFSAIEARVIAWLAGEQWRLDVFSGHGKIYEASAAQMFGAPLESITKGSPLRQKGKIAELALGYQGAVGALIKMGALEMGLTEEELPEIVGKWRAANPNIVRLWHDTNAAAIKAVISGREKGVRGLVSYATKGDYLLCRLPSGRCLCYAYPEIHEEQGFKKLSCMEQDQTSHKWKRSPTYGGKLVENCLAGDSLVLTDSGWTRLDRVSLEHLLWDGEGWVSHNGLISQGIKNTISVNGVRMTPEHLVLTEEGWKDASSCEEYTRYPVALPYRGLLCRVNRCDNVSLSAAKQLSPGTFILGPGRYEPVYDILNAGPRKRFTVMGLRCPFLVHNCVQGIARDCLAVAMLRVAEAGFDMVMHVHDEIVVDAPEDKGSAEELAELMGQPIPWAKRLPLRADAFEANYYLKD